MGLKLYVRRFGANLLDVVDLTTGTLLRTLTTTDLGTSSIGTPLSIPTQGVVYVTHSTGIVVLDAQTDTVLRNMTFPAGGSYSATTPRLSPDGAILYFLYKATGDAGTGLNSVAALSTADGTLLGRFRYDTGLHFYLDLTLSRDGSYLYVAANGNTNGDSLGYYTRFTVSQMASGGAGVLVGNYYATRSVPFAGTVFLGSDSTAGGQHLYRLGEGPQFSYTAITDGITYGIVSGMYLPGRDRAYVTPGVHSPALLDPHATAAGTGILQNAAITDANTWAALPDESLIYLSRSAHSEVTILNPATLAVLGSIPLPGASAAMSLATDTPPTPTGLGGGVDDGDGLGHGCFVALTWAAQAGVTFTLSRDGVVIASGLTGTSYTDPTTHAQDGLTLTYALVAVNGQGQSAPATVTAVASCPAPCFVPEATACFSGTAEATQCFTGTAEATAFSSWARVE